MEAYGSLLARAHHGGFGGTARAAARTLLAVLRAAGHGGGTVVDLGCGSGILARLVLEAGYGAVGIDQSAEMLALAREHAPGARFVRASLAAAELPPCVAVACVGECFNYTFDDAGRDHAGGLDVLEAVARQARAALAPGGVLLLDAAGPGRAGPTPREGAFEEGDLHMTFRAEEDAATRTLRRTIVSVRRPAEGPVERSEERHVLHLFEPEEVEDRLARAGFEVARLEGYEGFTPPAGWHVFLARAPR